MHCGNPFLKNTLIIYESDPLNSTLKTNIQGISICPNPNDLKAKVNLPGINQILNKLKHPELIKLFEIDYNSNLLQIPELSIFQNIEYAHIAGRKINSYLPIYNLPLIKSLFLVNFKEHDLDRFAKLKIEYFRAIRGNIKTINIASYYVLLQNCNRLIKFDDSSISILIIEQCHNLILDSISNIDNLKELHILGRRAPIDLNFIQNCKKLEHLVITTIPQSKLDIYPIINNYRLKKCFIGMANDSFLCKISAANNKLIITNGDSCYLDSQKCDYHKVYEK